MDETNTNKTSGCSLPQQPLRPRRNTMMAQGPNRAERGRFNQDICVASMSCPLTCYLCIYGWSILAAKGGNKHYYYIGDTGLAKTQKPNGMDGWM